MIYTGIGSRKIPPSVASDMENFAAKMALMNYTLRSGAADGADTAFERGADSYGGRKEIFLPWRGFNGSYSIHFGPYDDLAYKVAKEVYGSEWDSRSPAVHSLMTRNVCQVVGENLKEPLYSKFLICWTPDGVESHEHRTRKTGGTGQAIALASSLQIPVFNMANDNWKPRIAEFFNFITLFSE